jgi:hypothetical protein
MNMNLYFGSDRETNGIKTKCAHRIAPMRSKTQRVIADANIRLQCLDAGTPWLSVHCP